MKNKNGFTLIELLIVIAIIGLLTAVLFPTIISARRNAVNTASQVYARNVSQWVTSWLSQDATRNVDSLETSCTHANYVGEGADATLPNFILSCEVLIDPNGDDSFGSQVTARTGQIFTNYQ